MSNLSSLRVEAFFAGHCQQAGSNKHWAAVLAEALDKDNQPLGWAYTNVFGAVGSSYRVGTQPTPLLTRDEAQKAFDDNVKRQTSAKKGYKEIAGPNTGASGFSQFAASFPFPLLMLEDIAFTGDGGTQPANPPPQGDEQHLAVALPPLSSIPTLAQAMEFLESEAFGASEKIDGVRCPVSFDGSVLLAFNRSGTLVTPPPGALSLQQVGFPLIVDGERVTHKYNGQHAGLYVIFGLLAWKDELVQEWSQDKKERVLEETLTAAGLIRTGGPTLRQALEGTCTSGLALLTMTRTPEEARAVVEEVSASKGEGLVIRARHQPESEPKSVRKYKHYPTIDVFAIGIHRTGKTGSVKVGLVRPSNGDVIHICNVRSGLNQQDVQEIDTLLQKGTPVVFELSFLLSSTTKLAPHQPSIKKRRTDKAPRECTTDQLIELIGQDRSPLVEVARAVQGLPFEL